jgi:hypothetical protein
VSTYSFDDHIKTFQIRVLRIQSGLSEVLVHDAKSSEPVWLSENEFLHLKSWDDGTTSIMVRRALSPNDP